MCIYIPTIQRNICCLSFREHSSFLKRKSFALSSLKFKSSITNKTRDSWEHERHQAYVEQHPRHLTYQIVSFLNFGMFKDNIARFRTLDKIIRFLELFSSFKESVIRAL